VSLDKPDALEAFLTYNPNCVLVTVGKTRGSTPREEGAFMLISSAATFGTVGGGQLEYSAIDEARRMLIGGKICGHLDIKLGPDIGQCCGGEVALALERLDAKKCAELARIEQMANELRPYIYIFGAGHVGNALARAFSLLPVKAILVDQRESELNTVSGLVETVHSAMPEGLVRSAPPGSAFLVLTHDHALDFLIVREALARTDSAYVGMIGSKSKRGTFKHWYLREGGTPAAFSRLVCPIGGPKVKDKRPAVIAALSAAEVMTALPLAQNACHRLEPVHV
jgi:xanthine dehydrogenase accessory factor